MDERKWFIGTAGFCALVLVGFGVYWVVADPLGNRPATTKPASVSTAATTAPARPAPVAPTVKIRVTGGAWVKYRNGSSDILRGESIYLLPKQISGEDFRKRDSGILVYSPGDTSKSGLAAMERFREVAKRDTIDIYELKAAFHQTKFVVESARNSVEKAIETAHVESAKKVATTDIDGKFAFELEVPDWSFVELMIGDDRDTLGRRVNFVAKDGEPVHVNFELTGTP